MSDPNLAPPTWYQRRADSRSREIRTIIREMEAFDAACLRNAHTDTGAVWENLLRWKNALQRVAGAAHTPTAEDLHKLFDRGGHPEDPLRLTVVDLQITTRLLGNLRQAGIEYVWQLVQYSQSDFKSMVFMHDIHMGSTAFQELREVLSEYGLALKDDQS
jgi:DNA-directed RNA polymerase alpha subunit